MTTPEEVLDRWNRDVAGAPNPGWRYDPLSAVANIENEHAGTVFLLGAWSQSIRFNSRTEAVPSAKAPSMHGGAASLEAVVAGLPNRSRDFPLALTEAELVLKVERGACSTCTAGQVVCPGCRGNQRITCRACTNGVVTTTQSQRVACAACKGSGAVVATCPACAGRGLIRCPTHTGLKCLTCSGDSRIQCTRCKGTNGAPTGRVKLGVCASCAGTRETSVQRSVKQACTRCAGKALENCPKCSARGVLSCGACDGTGSIAFVTRASRVFAFETLGRWAEGDDTETLQGSPKVIEQLLRTESAPLAIITGNDVQTIAQRLDASAPALARNFADLTARRLPELAGDAVQHLVVSIAAISTLKFSASVGEWNATLSAYGEDLATVICAERPPISDGRRSEWRTNALKRVRLAGAGVAAAIAGLALYLVVGRAGGSELKDLISSLIVYGGIALVVTLVVPLTRHRMIDLIRIFRDGIRAATLPGTVAPREAATADSSPVPPTATGGDGNPPPASPLAGGHTPAPEPGV